jgi:hypothetical protein
VSDLGRVRRLETIVHFSDGRVRKFPARLCKFKISRFGYPLVLLSAGVARKKWVLVHRLVLRAFQGEAPAGMQACHNDGNPLNARLTNLRWDSVKANMADKWKHGTMPAGESHPTSVYPDALVREVLAARGTISDIAARFGMSGTHVWNIKNGKRRAVSTGL